MRTVPVRYAALSALALALAACSGGVATPSGVPTLPPVNVPSIPPLPSGLVMPSFSIPSFAADPVIDQTFPDEIAGQPVTDQSSANFLSVMQSFGMAPERIAEFVAGMQAIGVDPAGVGFGSGTVTLDDEDVTLQLIRFPGGNAGNALDALTRIDEPEEAPTLTTETIGGKSVTVATNPDGDIEYFYINGDLAWLLDNAERSQVETIFAELP
jgi:hypothetical protein